MNRQKSFNFHTTPQAFWDYKQPPNPPCSTRHPFRVPSAKLTNRHDLIILTNTKYHPKLGVFSIAIQQDAHVYIYHKHQHVGKYISHNVRSGLKFHDFRMVRDDHQANSKG